MNQLPAFGLTLACELPVMGLLARAQPALRVLAVAAWYQLWLRAGFGRSFQWSLLANATSFGLGWLVLRS